MYHVNKLMKKTVVCLMLVVMLAVNLFEVAWADNVTVDISKEATKTNVGMVVDLAGMFLLILAGTGFILKRRMI